MLYRFFFLFFMLSVAFGDEHMGHQSEMQNDTQPHFVPFEVKDAPYVPVVTPNGSTLPWKMEDGVKVFHLIAEPVKRQFAPGLVVNCWGYNGQTPGPTIEVVEGDRVRVYVTNKLPESTTVHWHGILLPNGMDGVTGLTQPPIPPGKTFVYEFILHQSDTHMYHPHADEMVQIGLGMMGFFIIHPKNLSEEEMVDRDFAIMLHEWAIPPGASTPDPLVMLDFNYFTFNGTVWPGTEPLIVKKGQKVRIRIANLSMDSHPIHLHGYEFTVVAQGGERMPKSAQYKAVTINVPVGDTRDIEFIADAPGDWAFHCHKTHHTMNGMVHDLPNLIGVNQDELERRIKKLLPGYMAMGSSGMGEMFKMQHQMHMQGPPNYLKMGSPGQFGLIELSGMFTVLKVREGMTNYLDPGWYQNPPGTIAWQVDEEKE
jgi:manganese oxidase